MKAINNFILKLGFRRDVILAVLVVLVIFMMILPLPTILMDILITFSMTLAILIMLVALRITKPLQFLTFPSILLISTLFRLAISISTTRLILVEGDAGNIIQTFGEVVIGGNLVVGLVIFLIITVVQFLVITKGADRVAEVTARFTLDGLPGKQMSIDADMRAGNISQAAAKSRRDDLELETKLFGSMDGAMKFVKGDAVAGLVITAINLIGGITIGMTQRGLSFSEAGSLYSTMTIGDGLVAQIPALLTSISSGTIVTRVAGNDANDLSTDMTMELSNNTRTLQICGITICIFGFIPGFPTVIFLCVGSAIGISGFLQQRKLKEMENVIADTWSLLETTHAEFVAKECEMKQQLPSVKLLFPKIIKEFDVEEFSRLMDQLTNSLSRKYGISFGIWSFAINDKEQSLCEITIKGQLSEPIEISKDYVFVKANAAYLSMIGIEVHTEYKLQEGCLIKSDYIDLLTEKGIEYLNGQAIFFKRLSYIIEKNLSKFVMIENTVNLLKQVEKTDKSLSQLLGETIPKERLTYILKKLLEEGISIANLNIIFEAILYWAPKEENSLVVVDKVREAIGHEITSRYTEDEFLPVVIVAPSMEGIMREGLRALNNESFIILDTDISDHFLEQVRSSIPFPHKEKQDPILITQADVRHGLRSILRERDYSIPVLSYQEIPADVTLYPVGFIQSEIED